MADATNKKRLLDGAPSMTVGAPFHLNLFLVMAADGPILIPADLTGLTESPGYFF